MTLFPASWRTCYSNDMEQRCECWSNPRYDAIRRPCPRCTFAIDDKD